MSPVIHHDRFFLARGKPTSREVFTRGGETGRVLEPGFNRMMDVRPYPDPTGASLAIVSPVDVNPGLDERPTGRPTAYDPAFPCVEGRTPGQAAYGGKNKGHRHTHERALTC